MPNRSGSKLSSATIEKRVERLLGLLGFLKLATKRCPTLAR